MKLSEFLVREAIITDLLATTKEGAIHEIVHSVQDAGHLAGMDTEILTGAVLEREELGSTAIGLGVALPHGCTPRSIACSGRSPFRAEELSSTRWMASRWTSLSYSSTVPMSFPANR